MYYSEIKALSVENGPGIRVSLFVSGCRNHCKGCFQPETWDFCYGQPFTAEAEGRILSLLGSAYISGLSVLGGEPFEEENQEGLISLLRAVRREYPRKSIWVYTGYIYDKDLVPGGRKYAQYTDELLSLVDVVVDGPYLESRRNPSLSFKGSDNQRIVDVPDALRERNRQL